MFISHNITILSKNQEELERLSRTSIRWFYQIAQNTILWGGMVDRMVKTKKRSGGISERLRAKLFSSQQPIIEQKHNDEC